MFVSYFKKVIDALKLAFAIKKAVLLEVLLLLMKNRMKDQR